MFNVVNNSSPTWFGYHLYFPSILEVSYSIFKNIKNYHSLAPQGMKINFLNCYGDLWTNTFFDINIEANSDMCLINDRVISLNFITGRLMTHVLCILNCI